MDVLKLTVVIVVVLLCTSVDAMSAEEQSEFEARRTYVFGGTRAERERIVSGQLVMRGEHLIRLKGENESIDPVHFDIAFDHVAKSYSYAHSEIFRSKLGTDTLPPPMNRNVTQVRSADGTEWAVWEAGGTLVRTNEYDLHVARGSSVVTRLAPGEAQGLMIYEPDVKCAGLLDCRSFKRSVSYEKVMSAFEIDLEVHSIQRNAAGLWEILFRARYTESEIWVDEVNGMTPIRAIVRDLREGLKERNRPEIVASTEVDWKSMKDVGVPVSLRMSGTSPNGTFESYQLTLEWSRINEPLDPKIFTAAGITENKNAVAMDMRLGQVVVERVHPHPIPVVTPKAIEPLVPKSRSQRNWLIWGNLVLCGIAFWIIRRQRKKS